MKVLDKALVIACAGKSMETLTVTGEKAAMETVMLGDRIRNRAKAKQMIIFDNITHMNEELREKMMLEHIEKAYRLGRDF